MREVVRALGRNWSDAQAAPDSLRGAALGDFNMGARAREVGQRAYWAISCTARRALEVSGTTATQMQLGMSTFGLIDRMSTTGPRLL